ncbi:MAG: universal stress protein [Thermodesulfovibrionia bacterium]
MKKVLMAVNETKGSKVALDKSAYLLSCINPETVVLLYVEKFEGHSLMDEMLGKAELSTLRDVLKGTEYQKALDEKAKKILEFYRKTLEDKGVKGIKTVIKSGHPAEEILNTAKQENSELLIMGSRGHRLHTLLMGSVSREVVQRAEIPVLVAQ